MSIFNAKKVFKYAVATLCFTIIELEWEIGVKEKLKPVEKALEAFKLDSSNRTPISSGEEILTVATVNLFDNFVTQKYITDNKFIQYCALLPTSLLVRMFTDSPLANIIAKSAILKMATDDNEVNVSDPLNVDTVQDSDMC